MTTLNHINTMGDWIEYMRSEPGPFMVQHSDGLRVPVRRQNVMFHVVFAAATGNGSMPVIERDDTGVVIHTTEKSPVRKMAPRRPTSIRTLADLRHHMRAHGSHVMLRTGNDETEVSWGQSMFHVVSEVMENGGQMPVIDPESDHVIIEVTG